MSEFQYYEFQAIDRPLDARAQEALRRISTRALITPHSLVNTYQWGDFKGDPRELVRRWFDLFIYWANWGERRLLIRLPRRVVDLAAIRQYRIRNLLEIEAADNHVILEIQRTIEDPDELPEETGASTPFAALRADLLRGDERCLYLGWLLGLQDGLISPKTSEPARPPGLSHPSGALHGFATFFGLDEDLLAVAAKGSGDDVVPEPGADELRAMIASLSEAEKTDLLCRAVIERDDSVSADLRRRWFASHRDIRQTKKPGTPRRTAQDLLKAAKAHAGERCRLEAERVAAERARRAEQERIERERRLTALAGREDKAWREVEAIAEEKRSTEYGHAVAVLKDLRLLAERNGWGATFNARIEQFRAGHRRKVGLMKRLRAAGL